MIKNQWYGILDSKEVGRNPVGVVRFNEKLVLWRTEDNKICCIYDQCCHRGAALSIGKLVHDELECPFHGFRYDHSGKVTLIPANGRSSKIPDTFKVHAYCAKEAYGAIWVWYGDETDEVNLPEIPFFEELRTGFTFSSFSEVWNVHYTRAIENQLDVVHLPFVHKTTIGRGNKTIVNGPVVKWHENRMTFYVDNVVDDGQTIPKKPGEIKNYESLFSLQFQMPNIWQNIISDQVRIVAIFAPVDDEHTRIYLRFYQRFANIPLLKYVIGKMSNYLNGIILHQDRHVVLTQIPKRTDLKMGEHLIQGDLPIIEYRKRRFELQNHEE